MLNETGLAARMREAWKSSGYTVTAKNGELMLNGIGWAVRARTDKLPRRCLGLLAEHMGGLPEDGDCVQLSKAQGAQNKISGAELSFWQDAERLCDDLVYDDPPARVRQTPLTIGGYELWQNLRSMQVLRVRAELGRILDAEARSDGGFLGSEGRVAGAMIFDDGDVIAVVIPMARGDDAMLQQLDGFPWRGMGE